MNYYLIKRGNHSCLHWPKFHLGETSLKAKFIFGIGSWYELRLTDDYGINKLCGWSFGHHHKNSIRCGWVPNENQFKIDLFFYVYSDGIRYTQLFTTVDTGKEYELSMDVSSGILSFSVKHKNATIALNSVAYKVPVLKFGYLLFPYIGGNLPARSDTYIGLQFI